jgi:hypothetical protein
MREVTTILLTDEDDEGRPIDARRRERPDRISEASGRVQERERGLLSNDRPAGRDPDDRCLVEREHELEIVRETTEERNLGGPRIREHRREPTLSQDIDDCIADRGAGHAFDSK